MAATIHNLIDPSAGRPPAPQKYPAEWMAQLESGITKLLDQKCFDQAFELVKIALQIAPQSPTVHVWAGVCLRGSNEIDGAQEAFRHALRLDPDNTLAKGNLGALLLDDENAEEAVALLDEAARKDPGADFLIQSLMVALLSAGHLERGWNLYSRRARFPAVGNQICKYPNVPWWDGRSRGKVLLVGEEGIGERILFASMIPDMLKTGAEPVIEITSGFERFKPWFQRSFPKLKVVGGGEEVGIDYQLVIGDLGQFFRRKFSDFPKHKGYMTYDTARARMYRHRLSPGPVVGICWKSISSAGPHKSIALQKLIPILQTPGVSFVDIQYASEDEECKSAPLMHRLPDLDKINDMDGMASLIGACDLIITASSVTAHMAGATGKPVWTFIPSRAGRMWFWLTKRDDSPWYPSMRLFRQSMDGKWEPAIERVASELQGFVQSYKDKVA